MPNAANRASVRMAEKEAQQVDAVRRQVVTGLMSHPDGRRWVHDELQTAHIFSTSFHADTHVMSFLEGERNSGLRLFNDIMRHCPEQFIQMMREKNARDDLNASRDSEPDADTDSAAIIDAEPGPNTDLFGADTYGNA